MGRRSRGRGQIESTQLAVLLPLVLGLIFAVIQASIFFAGRATVQQAAMAGAEHAAFAGAASGSAGEVARQIAERGGLLDIEVNVSSSGTTMAVSVQARVPVVVGDRWTRVSATAHRMREEQP